MMTIRVITEQILLAGVLFTFFPFSIICLTINFAYLALQRKSTLRHRVKNSTGFLPKTVLVTGVSNGHGFRVVRALHETTGHNIIGADFEPQHIFSYTRFSQAFSKFYRLKKNQQETVPHYIRQILNIIEKEQVDLWISCTNRLDPVTEAQARHIIERKTKCECFTLTMDDGQIFTSRNEFLSFINSIGLPAPEIYKVKSRDEIHNVLNNAQGKKKYALNAPEQANKTWPRTILPRRTISQTYHEVAQVKITRTSPWLLEQYIDGLNKYTTLSIIVQGKLKAFAASPISNGTNTFALLPPSSALNQSLLQFVQIIAQNLSSRSSSHLIIDFCVDERTTGSGVEQTILPMDARIQASPIISLFDGFSGSIDLSRAYTSLLANTSNGLGNNAGYFQQATEAVSVPSNSSVKIYSLGDDLINLVFKPLLNVLLLKANPLQLLAGLGAFGHHLLYCKEYIYDVKDPFPFWWFYQIQLPLQLVLAGMRGDNVLDDQQFLRLK